MIKHSSSLILGCLLVLSAAIISPSMGSSLSDAYMAEDADDHLALSFVNAAYAQSDQHMESKVYLPPAKQLESGTSINYIQCNEPRELYIRQSQIPVCLYAETYDLMQSRGIELAPAVFLPTTGIFSPEEAEWLADNPVIRVSYDPGLVPIEYLDDSGALQGVTLDYIAEFEAVSGADLVQGPIVETWAETLKTIEDRESDIIFIVAPAPERLEYMSFTSSHYSLKTYMASLSDAPLSIDDDSLALITIRGYAIESWLDENHPNIQYVSVDDQSEAFEVLQAGGADAFASTWPSVVHYSKLSGIDNIYNAGSTGYQYDLAVGYRNDLPILGSIMQKALDQIPQEKIAGWYDMISTPTDADLTPESIVMGVVDDIIALYDSDPESAFEQITSMMTIDPHYPFVIDPKTTVILAHGADPEHVGELVESEMVPVQHITGTGSDADESRATPDKPFDLVRAELREHGQAWVEYEYINPVTGAEKFKNSLFVLHDGYIFGSGYYTTQDLIVQGVVEDAIALYKNNPDSAFEDINSIMTTDPHYPFVLDPLTTRLVAHGTNPDRVGDVSVSFTASNVPQDVILSEIQNGSVWAEYTFANPLTGEIQSKRSILALYDGYIFGSGYYTTPESTTQNIVDEAIALYISDPDNAFVRINSMMSSDPSYPFVIDYNTGLIAAHGSNPGLVNTSSASAVVADRPFDVISSDLLEGYTWVKYIFENPATETKQSKRTLLVLHDGYVFGSGYYTELAPADIFSPEEIKWLTNNPVIRVSYDSGWVPIEYVDESGVLQGVTLDYIAEFEAVSGADLVHAPAAQTWTETLKAIEDRDSDILFMVASTPERLEYMGFTSPHYSLKTYIVSLSDAPLNIDDDSLVLITIRGYAIESWLDENHPDIQYVSVDDQSEAFEVLQAGGADAFASTWPVAVHYSKLSGIDNIYNAGSTGHHYDLTVGYRNDLPILGSIMQKTLDQIPQEKIDYWYDAISQTTDDSAELESIVEGIIKDTIALYDSDPENAFKRITSMELTNPQYPFVLDPITTSVVAHGSFPERVGTTSIALTESSTPLDVILSDLKEGNVWAEYLFANPATGTEQIKRSLFVLHDGYIFGSGYYTESESPAAGIPSLDDVE